MDANLNRAKEGLRVCEDISRFFDDDARFSRRWKSLRHDLTAALPPRHRRQLLAARDIEGDVGRGSVTAEMRRRDVHDIFYANAQRVKESLRVLEEFSKLLNPAAAGRLKRIRYRFYRLEQERATVRGARS